MSDLEARLLDAHMQSDKRSLVSLYTEAAHQAPTPDAAAFFLTQAYVYALETAHEDCSVLNDRLVAMGRNPD
ncbi:hypothetical protein LCL97_05720 [Seohaeicola saemankumensis]|nr:hypothetical protein [Seohaeicola saemankumensis]MCA0870311.1 hypothetical protein [Seohaeicola saemankumensis]